MANGLSRCYQNPTISPVIINLSQRTLQHRIYWLKFISKVRSDAMYWYDREQHSVEIRKYLLGDSLLMLTKKNQVSCLSSICKYVSGMLKVLNWNTHYPSFRITDINNRCKFTPSQWFCWNSGIQSRISPCLLKCWLNFLTCQLKKINIYY